MDGGIKDNIKDKMPSNVTLTRWISDEQLEDYFQRAKRYEKSKLRIKDLFSLEQRRNALLNLIDSLW